MFNSICVFVILAILQVIKISDSVPVYQFLPPREGYVPVYIRLGDTPLEEINPDLASAFHESNIHARNANDLLEEQMSNDAPASDDLSESVEELLKDRVKEVVATLKVANSDEDRNSETSAKSDDSEDKPKSIPVADKTSAEENDSEEEPAKVAEENDSDEVVVTTTTTRTTTKKPKEEPTSTDDVKKGKRHVSVPEPNTKITDSSEEHDDTEIEQQANSSNESKSNEE